MTESTFNTDNYDAPTLITAAAANSAVGCVVVVICACVLHHVRVTGVARTACFYAAVLIVACAVYVAIDSQLQVCGARER
jgi:hypothetical protein